MAILIDMTIMALLAGVLGYAVLVDRRVKILMERLRELQPLVSELSAAVDKSENSIRDLNSAATAMARSPAVARPVAQSTPAAATAAPAADKTAAAAAERAPATPATDKGRAASASGLTRITGKTDLVRGFFDKVRNQDS